MRRIAHIVLAAFLRIRARANQQHVADLEKMLSDLVTARDAIEAEITETTRRLLAARQRLDSGDNTVQTPALSPD